MIVISNFKYNSDFHFKFSNYSILIKIQSYYWIKIQFNNLLDSK